MKIDGACHCGYIRVEGEADPEKTTAAGAPLPEEKFPTRRRDGFYKGAMNPGA